MRKIPKYAAHLTRYELVNILCNCTRLDTLAQLVRDPRADPGATKFVGCIARCLKCGAVRTDNDRWMAF
jgi:hypothetical protein